MAENKKMNVYEKLLQVQVDLTSTKDKRNDFGKYNYRNAETILRNLRKYMFDYKFVVVMQDEIVSINDRYYVKAIAKMIDTESKESIETYALARESETKKGMDSAQVSGATSSYARKYALCALFAIDDGEDNDSPEYQEKIKEAEKEQEKHKKVCLKLAKVMKEKNINEIDLKKKFDIEGKVSELDDTEINGIIKKLEK